MERLKRLFFYLALPLLLLATLDHLMHAPCKNLNDKICGNLTHHPALSLPPLSNQEQEKIEAILSQPFTYMAKGSQAYVFESEDGKFILKFLKQQHARPKTLLDRLPLSFNTFFKNYQKRKADFQDAIESCKLSFLELKEESALIFTHLTDEPLHPKNVKLFDKRGKEHLIDLSKTAFVLQKKAELLYPRISSLMQKGDKEGAKKTISSLFAFLRHLEKRGVVENDPILRRNLGFVDGKAIQIDVGRIKIDTRNSQGTKKEIGTITHSFRTWIAKNYPELLSHVEKSEQALAALQPKINVSSLSSLADEELDIWLTGLSPLQKVFFQAETFDKDGEKWSSFAVFQADELGTVDLKKEAPLTGSYDSKDAMGLFWSLRPESGEIKDFQSKQDTIDIELRIPLQDQLICLQKIKRQKKAPHVKRLLIQDNGLIGALYLPPSSSPLPLVITLSGSNGGLNESRAKLLASRGFASLALGYFGVQGLPASLDKIPMEYFEKAFRWIQSHPAIDSKRVALYGVSRGAELALLLGSLFPDAVHAIIATVPSSAIYASLKDYVSPAWTYHGKAIRPSAPFPLYAIHPDEGKESTRPFIATPHFIQGMQNKKAFEAALIPIEKIRAPLLLISGGDDQIWPSFLFAKQIEQTIRKNNLCIDCLHLSYPKAGHQISIPYHPAPDPLYFHPVVERWFSMGGSPKEDELASRDSWSHILSFLTNSLQGKK